MKEKERENERERDRERSFVVKINLKQLIDIVMGHTD